MTWREWCETDYNTIGYDVFYSDTSYVVGDGNTGISLSVSPDEKIISGTNYTTHQAGPA